MVYISDWNCECDGSSKREKKEVKRDTCNNSGGNDCFKGRCRELGGNESIETPKGGCNGKETASKCVGDSYVSERSPCSSKPKCDTLQHSLASSSCRDKETKNCPDNNKPKCSTKSEQDYFHQKPKYRRFNFSKLSSECNKFVKYCMKPRPNTDCNQTPRIECRESNECVKRQDLSSRQTKNTKFSEMFPYEVNNKRLKECVEKYININPDIVYKKCAKYTKNTVQASEKCIKYMRPVTSKGQVAVKKSMDWSVGPRVRHMVSRWGTSAAIYLGASALFTVYITEWRVIPIYSDLPDNE